MNQVISAFLNHWRQIDFSDWNETDVRESFIAPLLALLGYGKGTVHDIITEKSLRLTTPYHRVGRKRIDIDYIPTVRLKCFWIIEAKPGSPKEMDKGDLLQAHLYAVHPEVQAQLIVLINGHSIRLYDAHTVDEWDSPILVCTQENCLTNFDRLLEHLGATSILAKQREYLINLAKRTFSIEIDEQALGQFRTNINKVLSDSLPVVQKNAIALRLKEIERREIAYSDFISKAKTEDLLIYMDIPERDRPMAAWEYAQRAIKATPDERTALIDRMLMLTLSRPHNIFRVMSLYTLGILAQNKIEYKGKHFQLSSVMDAITMLARRNISYDFGNDLMNALCHLDNLTLRLAKKISLHVGMKHLDESLKDARQVMSIEERISKNPCVGEEMVRLIGLTSESLWRQYCSKGLNDIWEGIWHLEDIEQEIDQWPKPEYPPGEPQDWLSFQYYGKGYDPLLVGTWSILQEIINVLEENKAADDILSFARLTREAVTARIPEPQRRPEFWVPHPDIIISLSLKYFGDFEFLRKITAACPDRAWCRFLHSILLEKEKSISYAKKSLDALVEQFKNNTNEVNQAFAVLAMFYKGVLVVRDNDKCQTDDADACFEKVAKFVGTSKNPRFQIAAVLSAKERASLLDEQGLPLKAEAFLRDWIETNIESRSPCILLELVRALLLRGLYLAKAGILEKPIEIWNMAWELSGLSPLEDMTDLALGLTQAASTHLHSTQKTKEAIEWISRLAAKHKYTGIYAMRPKIAELLIKKSAMLLHVGQGQEAVSICSDVIQYLGKEESSEFKNQRTQALCILGEILTIEAKRDFLRNEKDSAIEKLTQGCKCLVDGLNIDKPASNPLGSLGYAKFLLGQRSEGISLTQEAFRLGGEKWRRSQLSQININKLEADADYESLLHTLK